MSGFVLGELQGDITCSTFIIFLYFNFFYRIPFFANDTLIRQDGYMIMHGFINVPVNLLSSFWAIASCNQWSRGQCNFLLPVPCINGKIYYSLCYLQTPRYYYNAAYVFAPSKFWESLEIYLSALYLSVLYW